jgi:hypothetical protein
VKQDGCWNLWAWSRIISPAEKKIRDRQGAYGNPGRNGDTNIENEAGGKGMLEV